jgi:hypothetical protein
MNESNTPNEQAYQDIINDLGIQDLPEEIQNELVDRFGSLVFKAVINEALLKLDEQQREEVANLMTDDEDSAEKVLAYLADTVNDFDAIAKTQAENIKARMKEIEATKTI